MLILLSPLTMCHYVFPACQNVIDLVPLIVSSLTAMPQCITMMYLANMLNVLLSSITFYCNRVCACSVDVYKNVCSCCLCCLSGFCVCGLRCWLSTPLTRLWLLSPSLTISCSLYTHPASPQRVGFVFWPPSACVSDKIKLKITSLRWASFLYLY